MILKVRLVYLSRYSFSETLDCRAVAWYCRKVFDTGYYHVMLEVHEYGKLYGLSRGGVEEVSRNILIDDPTLSGVMFSEWGYVDKALFDARITMLIELKVKATTTAYIWYVLKKHNYTGQPLCTGLIELLVGLPYLNSSPIQLLRMFNEAVTLKT